MADAEFLLALRDSARDVVADHCAPHQLHQFIDRSGPDQERLDRGLWKAAAELGWLTLAIPEQHDGLGAGIVEIAVLQQELGRALAPIPYLSTVLVQRALTLWPHSKVQTEFFPAFGSGEVIAAIGPIASGGSNLVADPIGNGKVRIKGECAFVLEGSVADLFLLPVNAGGKSGLALLRRGAGAETAHLPVADRTRNVASLRCEGIEVSVDQVLIGAQAVELAEVLADDARILIANDCVGGAEAILDKTVEYLKTRVQFGKPIGSFQALKHRCADHKVRNEAAKLLVTKATQAAQAERGLWVGIAKFAACDAYQSVAADSVQLHGGMGFTWEHDSHLYLKRALLNQLLFGNSAESQDRAVTLLLAQEGGR
jgi:alkylation response protein AidB-like acyl-CoA dehydrogenase